MNKKEKIKKAILILVTLLILFPIVFNKRFCKLTVGLSLYLKYGAAVKEIEMSDCYDSQLYDEIRYFEGTTTEGVDFTGRCNVVGLIEEESYCHCYYSEEILDKVATVLDKNGITDYWLIDEASEIYDLELIPSKAKTYEEYKAENDSIGYNPHNLFVLTKNEYEQDTYKKLLSEIYSQLDVEYYLEFVKVNNKQFQAAENYGHYFTLVKDRSYDISDACKYFIDSCGTCDFLLTRCTQENVSLSNGFGFYKTYDADGNLIDYVEFDCSN